MSSNIKTGTIFYGFPLSSELLIFSSNQKKSLNESSFSYFKSLGFRIFEKDKVGFFGVELDLIHAFGTWSVNTIKLQPTAEQIESFHIGVKKLPEEIQKIIPKVNVYLMWHT